MSKETKPRNTFIIKNPTNKLTFANKTKYLIALANHMKKETGDAFEVIIHHCYMTGLFDPIMSPEALKEKEALLKKLKEQLSKKATPNGIKAGQ